MRAQTKVALKTAFKISLILNLGLLPSLLFLFYGTKHQAAPGTAPISAATPPAAPAKVPLAADQQPARPVAFHWSQLDSSDYRIYVKNLRAIGCPEPTVRAIVTADVHSVYAIFEAQLEQKLSAMENGSWSNQLTAFNSEPAVQAELQKIPGAENAKIADLLGLKPAQAQVAPPAPAVPLPVPLVLQNVDLSALNLNADQQQVVASLRGDFLKQTGGTNQDPNDPAYQARWQRAQSDADNMLEAMLGNDIYTRYQLAAHQLMLESLVAPAH